MEKKADKPETVKENVATNLPLAEGGSETADRGNSDRELVPIVRQHSPSLALLTPPPPKFRFHIKFVQLAFATTNVGLFLKQSMHHSPYESFAVPAILGTFFIVPLMCMLGYMLQEKIPNFMDGLFDLVGGILCIFAAGVIIDSLHEGNASQSRNIILVRCLFATFQGLAFFSNVLRIMIELHTFRPFT